MALQFIPMENSAYGAMLERLIKTTEPEEEDSEHRTRRGSQRDGNRSGRKVRENEDDGGALHVNRSCEEAT